MSTDDQKISNYSINIPCTIYTVPQVIRCRSSVMALPQTKDSFICAASKYHTNKSYYNVCLVLCSQHRERERERDKCAIETHSITIIQRKLTVLNQVLIFRRMIEYSLWPPEIGNLQWPGLMAENFSIADVLYEQDLYYLSPKELLWWNDKLSR